MGTKATMAIVLALIAMSVCAYAGERGGGYGGTFKLGGSATGASMIEAVSVSEEMAEPNVGVLLYGLTAIFMGNVEFWPIPEIGLGVGAGLVDTTLRNEAVNVSMEVTTVFIKKPFRARPGADVYGLCRLLPKHPLTPIFGVGMITIKDGVYPAYVAGGAEYFFLPKGSITALVKVGDPVSDRFPNFIGITGGIGGYF
ncbi:MAG: hypothetical protein ACUVXI_07510 [bacterium]